MNNWYYLYDKRDINDKDLKELSSLVENLGYEFYQPWGLGAGPSPEQVILWISNNQFLSTVALNLLSNYLYDTLKKIWSWYKPNKLKNKKIPVVEIFIKYKDGNSEISNLRFKFRIDEKLNKTKIKEIIKSAENKF